MTPGQIIKQAIKSKNLRVEEVASQICSSRQGINGVICGKVALSPRMAVKIAAALDIDAVELLTAQAVMTVNALEILLEEELNHIKSLKGNKS